MSSASRTGSEGLKGTRNLRTVATNSQPASSGVARFQIYSDTELEAEFSESLDEEDQQITQSAAADSNDEQFAFLARPIVFDPDAPDPLYQRTAADSRSFDFFQARTSEKAANSLAEARARHVVASNTPVTDRQVSNARAEAAQLAEGSQRAISSIKEEPAAAASRADAARAPTHSEVVSPAARAEQHAAKVTAGTTEAAACALAQAAQSVAQAVARAEPRARAHAQGALAQQQQEHFRQELHQTQAQANQVQANAEAQVVAFTSQLQQLKDENAVLRSGIG
jgi:hypothetical protein